MSSFYNPSNVNSRLQALELPVSVNHNWLNRQFYSISLQQNTFIEYSDLRVCNSYYLVKLYYANVLIHKHLQVLKFIFEEVFFIMQYNDVTVQGQENVRIVLTADSLISNINLKAGKFNSDSVNRMLTEIVKTLQSNEELLTDSSLSIMFCSCKSLSINNA